MSGEARGSAPDLLDRELHRRVMSSFRLTVKLVVMLALIFVVLGGIVFVVVDRIFAVLTPSIRYDLEWKARHGVIELCSTSDLGVVANDAAAVSEAARELTSDPDVVAILVTGQNGEVWRHGQVPFSWYTVIGVADGGVVERDGLFVSSGPVSIEGLEVGRVSVAVSLARLSAGRELRDSILRAGALGALVALVLALAFVQYDIAPLIKLTAQAFKQLERKTAQALESARIKSEFLANMSHEIRTPMNGIMGVTKLALLMPMDPKLRRYLEIIDSSARGLMTIINDVLDFSKLEAGKYRIRPQDFDPRQVVSDTVALFSQRAHEKGLSLDAIIADDVPSILNGDPDRIKQILDNLVGNACKFTEHGEVSVHMSFEQVDERRFLSLRVEDTGCGIAPDAQRSLFQAFTQVDGSYVREHGGTGLGLAIAKRLTELMGGEIGLSSELGRGSAFWFKVRVDVPTLAVRDGASSESHPSPDDTRPGLRTERPILVVDDNEINRMVVVEHLGVHGYKAETAVNGAEALEAVFRKDYAAVLMDCQMPVMDGYAATRAIRQRERQMGLRRVPIIAVTAHVLEGEREHVLASGMDDHVPKPVTPSSLEGMLARWVGAPRALHSKAPSLPPPAAVEQAPVGLVVPPPAIATEPSNRQQDLPAELPCSPAIVELFLRLAPGQLSDLENAARARDATAARAQAHKLKGALYTVGASQLADLVEAVRTDIAAGGWSIAHARLAEVAPRFTAVCTGLRAMVVQPTAAPGSSSQSDRRSG